MADVLRDWIAGYIPSPQSDSPMEALFYGAWKLLEPRLMLPPGVVMRQQEHVGDYRADFFFKVVDKDGTLRQLVVEVDGHDFHERTKAQAAHDKSRDRWMTGNGYHVMRFTGSEVYANPFKCAQDVADRIYVLHYGESQRSAKARAGLEAIRRLLED